MKYIIDIGINFEEENINGARDFYLKASIEDIGDLSVFQVMMKLIYLAILLNPEKQNLKPIIHSMIWKKLYPVELYKQGYTNVIIKQW